MATTVAQKTWDGKGISGGGGRRAKRVEGKEGRGPEDEGPGPPGREGQGAGERKGEGGRGRRRDGGRSGRGEGGGATGVREREGARVGWVFLSKECRIATTVAQKNYEASDDRLLRKPGTGRGSRGEGRGRPPGGRESRTRGAWRRKGWGEKGAEKEKGAGGERAGGRGRGAGGGGWKKEKEERGWAREGPGLRPGPSRVGLGYAGGWGADVLRLGQGAGSRIFCPLLSRMFITENPDLVLYWLIPNCMGSI